MREKKVRDTLQSLRATRNRLDRAITALEEIIEYDLTTENQEDSNNVYVPPLPPP